MKELLNVQNLSIRFGNKQVLSNVSFAIGKGEVMGLVGESGSGKSITSLAIMRLLDEKSATVTGSILYNDKDLLLLPQQEMQRYRGTQIAMIFQEPMTSLNPVYTCGHQVAEGLIVHHKLSKQAARKRSIELFEEVQLPRANQLFDAYPHQLSGGQRQRIMIAMALACNPQLLIADEPTTALDVTVQQSIIELLQTIIANRGMSLLFISHDLGLVASIADNVAVMHKGEIVEMGTADAVFHHPQQAYTKGLVASRPNVKQHLRRLPTIAHFLETAAPLINNTITQQDVVARHAKLYAQEPLVQVNKLTTQFITSKNFIGKPTAFVNAVNEVSLAIYPGETVGLVGESGCGKTTLGRSILQLIPPNTGSVLFNGTELTTLSSAEMRSIRKQIQIIFQDPYSSLNPRMRIGEAITEPMWVHSLGKNDAQRKEKAIYLLEKVGLLPEHYQRYPHEFSGGQRQRVCIARALALEPQFIICDESVSALDVSVQAQVLNLLADLRDEMGLTYLFISHDLAVIKHFCDRILVMQKGKIVEEGYPEELFTQPKEKYTADLIAAIPQLY